ncbi:hypothetical protein GGS26DRAFT_42051 [Hypomontagnella submonticulosa]|nr:hypothetical protein GGS26DRAFT_42051 [Hypomontagnella submonticulosa]
MAPPTYIISRVADPMFAVVIGLGAAATRINREGKEKGRTTGQTVEAAKRRVSNLFILYPMKYACRQVFYISRLYRHSRSSLRDYVRFTGRAQSTRVELGLIQIPIWPSTFISLDYISRSDAEKHMRALDDVQNGTKEFIFHFYS